MIQGGLEKTALFLIQVCYTFTMSFDPEQITFFAQTDARGQNVPFGIKAKDRARHVYVIGKTGMGKSTLLENMAIQDIKNGNGLAFIDPHGQTAETLLDYIPESRKDDVLYFAPFDTENPVSFNVMEDVGPDKRHLVVSGLMSVFKKIWVDAWSARMEYILQNTLMALLEYPDSTLLGVNRMLSDKKYRKKVVDNIKDPSVRSFWVDEFANYNERYMQEAGDAIKNKIGQFTANPLIRNIVGQPKSSFDIREMMDNKKILIMNLSKGLVGESNANLLGSMLTTRIYLAAMSRADMGQEQMRNAPNFYFYVDEFQSFANATFANILSEARKYKLNLTIAHQYIEQMEEEVRNAVFGNVGTIIAFRVGPFDAEILETIFTPKFLAPDIVNLGFAQVYLTLMIDGIGSQPFSATTLSPIKPAAISAKEMIVHRSREQFSFNRALVEKNINDWHAAEPEPPRPERKEAPRTEAPKTAPARVETPKAEVREVREVTRSVSAGEPRRENHVSQTEGHNERHAAPREEGRREGREFNKDKNPRGDRPHTPAHSAYEQRHEQHRPHTDAPKSSKNLDELRAVLRNISVSETPKAQATESAAQIMPATDSASSSVQENRGQTPVKEVSLKDALSAALKIQAPSTEIILPVPVAPLKVEVAAVGPQTIVPTLSVSVIHTEGLTPVVTQSEVTEKHQAEPQVSTHVQPQEEDPLSPKKLERMMRVTGGDKTPLG